jgi:hypothetical protein
MKRASYKTAVEWMAYNDDTTWLDEDEPIISVSAALVRDIFEVDDAKLFKDLRRIRKHAEAQRRQT